MVNNELEQDLPSFHLARDKAAVHFYLQVAQLSCAPRLQAPCRELMAPLADAFKVRSLKSIHYYCCESTLIDSTLQVLQEVPNLYKFGVDELMKACPESMIDIIDRMEHSNDSDELKTNAHFVETFCALGESSIIDVKIFKLSIFSDGAHLTYSLLALFVRTVPYPATWPINADKLMGENIGDDSIIQETEHSDFIPPHFLNRLQIFV